MLRRPYRADAVRSHAIRKMMLTWSRKTAVHVLARKKLCAKARGRDCAHLLLLAERREQTRKLQQHACECVAARDRDQKVIN